MEQLLQKIQIGNLIIWFIVLLFSLSFHEAAHAWTSERFGDDTGRMQGRITLNPIAHIDPIGTILFPILSAIGGIPLLGWAKPVQTNPLLWREKTKANIMVSAAGPLSNFILAVIAFIIIKALLMSSVLTLSGGYYTLVTPAAGQAAFMAPLAVFLSVMLLLNVLLGVFNFIPVPPLDGSHILEEMLPSGMQEAYYQIRPFGFILLYLLMFLGVFNAILKPVYSAVLYVLGA
ncbi:MAG TPA: site-2 protease family protein [Blastocatellia bacterium]|nr:site-2 protease family protein [Blastocatellia bacterium]